MTDRKTGFALALSGALALAVLLVASCRDRGFRTADFNYEEAFLLKKDRGDALNIDVHLEYPRSGFEQEVLDGMTRAILSAAFDLEDEPTTVEETCRKYVENLKDEYFTEFGNIPDEDEGEMDGDILRSDDFVDWQYSWDDHLNGYFAGSHNGYRSYIVEYSGYRGGVHPLQGLTAIVLEDATGNPVPEETFFADGYAEGISALLKKYLEEEDPEAWGEVLDQNGLCPNGNYAVSESGVTWFFQPFEVAPFTVGLVSVEVPWDDLAPYLP